MGSAMFVDSLLAAARSMPKGNRQRKGNIGGLAMDLETREMVQRTALAMARSPGRESVCMMAPVRIIRAEDKGGKGRAQVIGVADHKQRQMIGSPGEQVAGATDAWSVVNRELLFRMLRTQYRSGGRRFCAEQSPILNGRAVSSKGARNSHPWPSSIGEYFPP
jgi:hypothetical protein